MTLKECKAAIIAQNFPFNTPVYKLSIIDGNDGSTDNEYFLDRNKRDSECEGIEDPYYYERYTISFKKYAFS